MSDTPRGLIGPALVRVMVEHTPSIFALFGMVPLDECHPVLELPDADGERHTYYRARSTVRWVYYKPAIVGAPAPQAHPDLPLHPEQR